MYLIISLPMCDEIMCYSCFTAVWFQWNNTHPLVVCKDPGMFVQWMVTFDLKRMGKTDCVMFTNTGFSPRDAAERKPNASHSNQLTNPSLLVLCCGLTSLVWPQLWQKAADNNPLHVFPFFHHKHNQTGETVTWKTIVELKIWR